MKLTAPKRAQTVLLTLARDPGLWLYSAVLLLGAPLLLWRKWRLYRAIKADCEFDCARWTLRFPDTLKPHAVNAMPTTGGPRVMIFAQGWGEVETIKPLVAALRARRPALRLLFSARHHEGIVPAAQLSDEAVSPVPFDNPFAVARWLNLTRPDLVIFYEKFWFATLLRSLWLHEVPFVIVNTRAKRRITRSALVLAFKRWQLRGLRAACVSSPDYAPALRQLVDEDSQVRVVGSIKFPHAKPQLAPAHEADLRAWIEAGAGGAPLLVAGSTRETEEEFVLDAFAQMRRDGNAPALLLAPRQLARVPAIIEILQKRDLAFSRRSQPRAGRVDVLLLDTLGELGVVYGHGIAAFVGGTINGNSHNVAEPLAWHIPVAYGPKRGNFAAEQQLCEEAGVGFRVRTPDELAAHWTQLLQSPDLRAELGRKAGDLVAQQSDAFERTLQILIEAIDSIAK